MKYVIPCINIFIHEKAVIRTMNTDVAVIGAGATGLFTALDLSLRGIKVTVIDRGGLINGTSGRMHGLLHSGARYVTNDLASAKQCIEENQILSRIAPHAVFDTKGLFVAVKGDDEAFIDQFVKGLDEAGIPHIEIDNALELEPNLSRDVKYAVQVPDKVVDPFKLFAGVAYSAKKNGAKFLLYAQVKKISGSKIITSRGEVESRLIINAAGPWAPRISAMHSNESKVIELMPTIGVMLVYDKRLNNMVLNRLRPPSDGDILVPYYGTSILGTTAQVVEDPDNAEIADEDIQYLIEEGSAMVPRLSELQPKRYYYSVRPLLKGSSARAATRDFEIYDEGDMLTIVGGKLTTSRLMAEKLSDLASEKLGKKSKSITANTLIPDALSFFALKNTIGDEIYGSGYALSKLEEAIQND